jgi:hypothetical protein
MMVKIRQSRNPYTLLGGMQISTTMENSGKISKKLETEPPYDPGILPMGIYPKKHKT